PEVDARDEHGQRCSIGRIRQRIEDLTVQYALLPRALHVHDWCFTGDRDSLLDPANPHVGVDTSDEVAGKLDTIALHRGETTQRERDRVEPGLQILNRVL